MDLDDPLDSRPGGGHPVSGFHQSIESASLSHEDTNNTFIPSSTTTTGNDDDMDDDSQSDSSDYGNYASTEVDEDLRQPEECWRQRFICPSQGRFFGDQGSFVDYFDPLQGGEQYCSDNSVAPFGPMVVWRVISTFTCEGGCDLYDDAIDAGIPPIPFVTSRTTDDDA